MTQDELLVLIYKKDEKAFNCFYDMYSKSLFSVISSRIQNPEEAETVLQEVFVTIWKNLDTYQESKIRFYTWILTVTREIIVNRLHSNNNEVKKLSPEDSFVHLPDNQDGLINKADIIGIQEFAKRLKPKCIQIIDLLFFKGLTQDEVAKELEIPLEAVKTQNRTCINDLRNYLKL